jgi:tRNA-splicing ligase RtcB
MAPTRVGDVLTWASDIEDATIAQAQVAASLPIVRKPLALMPDAHVGIGATIGSVIATEGAIIPSAVGVDIGCGMAALECPFGIDALPDDLGRLHTAIAQVVPAGLGRGHDSARAGARIDALFERRPEGMTPKMERAMATQIGSLGSGNHFVEVCSDEDDRVWLVLHSGSRGVGNQLANQHIAGAKGLMADRLAELPDPNLAYLVDGTPAFQAYVEAMLWAQDYAALNRDLMLDAALAQVAVAVGREFDAVRRINCHHNYAEREIHDGVELWVTRKGAIRAASGDMGIIPGSMATGSFVVEGLGNPASYQSCSHGAGRRMSRGQARRELDVDTLRAAMAGRAWNDRDAEKLIDEDPRSYKDLGQVMADQLDLVRPVRRLQALLNYKGT